MPRKKTGKKATSDVNDENTVKGEKCTENGIEKDQNLTSEDKIDNHDTNSIDSKSSRGSSISLKKRFSFGKRKKNLEYLKRNKPSDQETNITNASSDIRRTNSLNNINQDGGRSKIPVLKPKRQHIDTKHGSKHELCSMLQKNGCCESRSLVLNPGMDSWRMAGLMDTVNSTYSSQTFDSLNSLPSESCKPPNVALCSRLTQDSCKKSLEKVSDDEVRRYSPEMFPILIVTESVEGEISTEHNRNTAITKLSEQEEDNEIEAMHPDLIISAVAVELKTEKTVCMGAPFDTHKEISSNSSVAIVTNNINNEPIQLPEIILDNFSDGDMSLDNQCAVEPVVLVNEIPSTNGLRNDTVVETPVIQDIYELDDDNIISIRKLKDMIAEYEIDLPKEVCCDDWLVLDITHSAIVST